MTFSIVARDDTGASFGVAVASKYLAVGNVVPWGAAGVGAIATQALANAAYGPAGLAMLRSGFPAPDVVKALVAGDEQQGHRQLGIVDASGLSATHTGSECFPWCGGVAGDGFAAQGNILAGPEVVEAMVEAWRSGSGQGFAYRLLAALAAGDAAGGDRRGRQSAALLVIAAETPYGPAYDRLVDLRVDDHPEPVGELARLASLHELYFGKADPAELLPLRDELATEVAAALGRLGYGDGGTAGLADAFQAWSGTENFEHRHVPGSIDPTVLEVLRRQAGGGPGPR